MNKYMGFFDSIGEGWKLFKDSITFLFRKPVFLVPIFLSWAIFAGIVLYMRYYFVMPDSFMLGIGYFYILIFIITLAISFANVVMLELIQQIESGEDTSFLKAFWETISLDLLKLIPVAAIWAVLWVIILILKALTSRKKGGGRAEPSARDAARTLGGADSGPFSWLGLGLNMIEKVIRMGVFLALPAIAWENKGPFSAFSQSFRIIKAHPVQFLTTYTLTGFAALLMALPLLPVFLLDDMGVSFSSMFWTIVILYEAVVWTLGIYLEQMSVGLLYLWHLKWVRNGSSGELSSVPKPNLMDNVHELKKSVVGK